MGKRQVIAALREQRRTSVALLTALDEPDWELPCLVPWRVRDVVTHLIALDDAARTGRLLPLLRGASGRADVERWNDQVVRAAEEATPAVLLAELQRAGERLAGRAQRIPALVWRLPLRTVFGHHPLHFLLARRVLDEWVHSVDVARACDLPPAPVVAADVLAGAVLDALPALMLPQLELTAGVVRLVVSTGAVGADGEHEPRRTWALDFARRHYGPRVTALPDATVRLHAGALALLVEGRPPEGYGPVVVDGDEDLGERLLAVLPPR